ncbi:MAG: tetratricopeptide repeat protein [Acidobacteria bacterium]|nr:tetratricopeptide repeat protein [Acidobacteriota bacterium]
MSERGAWLRVARPLGLLALFVLVIRGMPERARPATPPEDCEFPTESTDVPRLERCLAVHPDDVEIMLDLAKTHETAQRWDRAEALYRRALETDPDDGDAHARLGALLLRRGDLDGAAREAAAALALQPGNPSVQALIDRARRAPDGSAP